MLIDDLIRMAKPLLQGGMEPQEIVRMISDVSEPNVRNFYRHVFVVEIPSPEEGKAPVALPVQAFGDLVLDERGKEQFHPDARTLAAPFSLPRGGNPLYPQGTYGIPVYPVWIRRRERDGSWTGQLDTPELAGQFLVARLDRTPGLQIDEDTTAKVADCLCEAVENANLPAEERVLGLVILVRAGENEMSPYVYSSQPGATHIGHSRLYPGMTIVPDYKVILEAIWEAKIDEGASKGTREGRCSICRAEGKLVTPYAKSWPWALPEWKCPFPMAGDEGLWVEGVALCRECSKALTLGAKVFEMLTRLVHKEIVREVFSPADDHLARSQAGQRQRVPRIYGSAYIVPVDEQLLEDPELRTLYTTELTSLAETPDPSNVPAERHLSTVVGFDLFLREEVDQQDLRLTLVYFHGDPGRGDIHVRAVFEEVRPSTLRRLRDIAKDAAATGKAVYQFAYGEHVNEGMANALHARYQLVPYLLGRAYGGAYLWDCLRAAFRREPLGARRFVRNAARRMQSLAHRLSENGWRLVEEVSFFFAFLRFLEQYREVFWHVSQGEGSGAMAMRPWKEMLRAFSEEPPEEMRFESPEELGFACGMLLRQFSRWYWGRLEKDYLQHRVMTFGTDLSPDAVWRRGLAKIFDVAARTGIGIPEDFRRRVGVALAEFERMREDVRRDRDSFMAAFWSGYALSGASAGEAHEQEPMELGVYRQ